MQRLFTLEKKKRINKRTMYRDFFIKATIKGVVRSTSKADAVVLNDAEILNWYAVSVSGNEKNLEFSISEKPQGDNITAYIAPKKGVKTDMEGFLTQGALKKARFCLTINRKFKIYIGDDPLSLATEICLINRIMEKRKFKGDIILRLEAESIGNDTKSYYNATIKNWKNISNNVSLYEIQNYIGDTVELTEDNAL
jgi:S-adenosylmethionine:tRNA-ribosyltransferase-isomerase (queuine synthetase)